VKEILNKRWKIFPCLTQIVYFYYANKIGSPTYYGSIFFNRKAMGSEHLDETGKKKIIFVEIR